MIKIEHLTKKYQDHVAVDDLNLTIEPGRIYGFLGPNGAGKSTTMNIITGYLAATSGTVTVNGYDIFKDNTKAKAHIGYLPEIPPLYPDMTVLEYLTFAAELKKIPHKDVNSSVDEACIRTGITDVAGRLIRNLSKGYKQRVGLAQAILGDPDIIILDEPTVGLDPAQIIEIRNLILELGKEHTVILSSHILSEISAVCSYVFIISHGHLVASDETEALLTRMKGAQEIDITVKAPEGNASDEKSYAQNYCELDCVDRAEIAASHEDNAVSLKIFAVPETDIREDVFKKTVEKGYTLLNMSAQTKSLEDVFLELTSTDEYIEETQTEATDTDSPDDLPKEEIETDDVSDTDDAGTETEETQDDTKEGGEE